MGNKDSRKRETKKPKKVVPKAVPPRREENRTPESIKNIGGRP